VIVLVPLAVVLLLGASVPLGLVIRRDGWPALLATSPTLGRADDADREPVGEPEPQAERPAGPPGPERLLLLLGAVAVPLIVTAYFNRKSGFTWDDIKNLRQAQVDGLSWRYLVAPTSGHWAPGHRFGDWVQQAFFGYNFAASQAMLLAGFAVTLLLFHRIVVELSRPGKGPILLTLLYGASYIHAGIIQWWAAGLDRVPATVFIFLSILAYLRFFKTHSWAWLAVSLLAIPLGFLFFIKAVFVPVYVVAIRVLLLEPGRPLGETLREAVGEWKVWLAYAVFTAIPLYNYISKYPTHLNDTPDLGTFAEYLSILWFRVVAPSFFGVFIPRANVTTEIVVAVAVVVQVVVVGLVVWTLWKFPGAWRGWAFFLIGFAANAIVVGLTRVGVFEPEVMAYYFNLEVVYLFFLAMGAIFLRRRSGPAPPAPRRPPRFASPVYPRLLAAGVVAYVALNASGAHQINDYKVWTGAQARVYTDNIAADLRQIRDAGRAPALVDSVVPQTVVPTILAPYNSLSEVVPLFDEEVTFDPEGRDLFAVTSDGNLRAVTREVEFGGEVQRLMGGGSVALHAVTSRPDERGTCFTTGSTVGVVAVTLPGPLTGEDLYFEMRYSTAAPSTFALIPEPAGGVVAGQFKTRVLTLPPGRDRAGVFPVPEPSLQRMVLAIGPRGEVCLSRLALGRLVRA
jgi:hypothetical protein